MNLSLAEVAKRLKGSEYKIRKYLEDENLHTTKQIDSYIKIINNTGKRVVTPKGFEKAKEVFGERFDVVEQNSSMADKIIINTLRAANALLDEELKYNRERLFLSENIEVEKSNRIEELQNTNEKKEQVINDTRAEVKELKYLLEIQSLKHESEMKEVKARSLLKRIFNK